MAEKKYKGRRAYLNDFRKNEKGDYEYQGSFYEWSGEKAGFRRELFRLWSVYAVMQLALIAAGCMDVPGAMNSFFVVLPFSVSFVFGISVGWGLWRLTTGGNPMRAYIFEASVKKLPMRSVGTMVFAAAAGIGEIVFMIRNGLGDSGVKIGLFLLLQAGIVSFAFIFLKKIRQMCWEKQT